MSIQCLRDSSREERSPENEKADLEERDWNWKSRDFRYAKTRAENQPGYVGSYVMDALSMALHCLWTTDSFEVPICIFVVCYESYGTLCFLFLTQCNVVTKYEVVSVCRLQF